MQTPLHSVATHDASTQLPPTEFFIGCILSNDPFDRQAPPLAHCKAGSASPPQPDNIATLCSPSSASHASDGHEHTTAPHVSQEPPPGLEKYARQYASHFIPVKAAPVRPRLCTSISVTSPQPHVSTTQVGSHPMRSTPTNKRSASTALAGTHNPVGADPRAGTGLFPKPRALVLPMVKFVNPNLMGSVTLIQPTVISFIINTVSLFFNGIQDRPAEILLTLSPLPVVSIMQLFFKKPVIMSRTSLDQFIAYTDNTDLAILLNKDTFEPDPVVLAFKEDSTSKGTWDMVLLIVRGLLRRPSLSGSPLVTFCSVHIHNVVAKKRDASSDLLRRLHGYMTQNNVDFIGADFNMSAFSTVGDVFSDTECSAPVNSFLWRLGALEEPNRERTGFLIMPQRPYEWRVDSHGCHKFDNAALGFGLRDQTIHLPVCLHLRTTNLPGPNSIMRSEQAQQRRFERRHNKHERMRRRRT